MQYKLLKLGLIVGVVISLSACANSPSYHKYLMQGQVVSVDDTATVVCIGSSSNPINGKTYDVYRAYYGCGAQEGDDGYKYRKVGELKGGATIDDHFAHASLLDGDIRKNDIVEFRP